MRTTESTFHGLGGAKLFYRKILKHEDTAKGVVIAVHGHGDHSGGLENLIRCLTENDYIVYSFDLRGHGRSTGIRGHINNWEEHRGDLHTFRQLVQSDFPNLPLYIAGHSLGGVITLDYTLFHGQGISGISCIAPAISYEATPFEKLLISIISRLKSNLTVKKTGNPDNLTNDPEILNTLRADPLRHSIVTPGLGRALLQTISRVMKEAPSIKIPLLLQVGMNDKLTPPGKIKEFYHIVGTENKQFYEYEGVCHRPFDDLGRERFLTDLVGWLDQQLAMKKEKINA